MKNQLRMLILATLTAGTMAINGMENISIPKIVVQVREFAEKVPTASVMEINEALEKALANIPNELLNIDVTVLPNGQIDETTAARIGNYLPQVKAMIDHVNALAQMPETALELFQAVYQMISAQLPISVQNTMAAGIDVASSMVNSTEPADKAAISAIQKIVSSIHEMVVRLASAQTAGLLVGYQIRNEINQFKATVLRQLPVIQAAIARNIEGIKKVIQQSFTITIDEVTQVGEVAKNLNQDFGLF